MTTGFEFINLKETTADKEGLMRKIGIAAQLHNIRSLLKQMTLII